MPTPPQLALKLTALLAIVLLSLAIQVFAGAYHRELATHPDEAAHFVSGVAAFDYLTRALGQNPVAFAETYYVHFPKVAFGHWPPGFYAIQAAWYAVFGPDPASGYLLMLVVEVAVLWLLFCWLQPSYRTLIAGLSSALFLALPVSRANLWLFLPDMLALLFAMLALFALTRALAGSGRRRWGAFAFWALLAILIKESMLMLPVVAVAALLGHRIGLATVDRRRMLRGAGFLLAAVGGALIYLASGVLHLREFSVAADFRLLAQRLPEVARVFVGGVSLPLLLVAAIGLLGIRKPAIRVATLLVAIVPAAQLVVRDSVEPRYFLLAYLGLVVLFAEGLGQVGSRLRRPSVAVWALGLGALATLSWGSVPARSGYAAAIRAVPQPSIGPVMLVSADSRGEGSLVAGRLMQDSRRSSIVLRASKLLSSADWMGRSPAPHASSADEVVALLDDRQVRYIVLDMNGYISPATRAHHRLLEAALGEDAGHFRLLSRHPLTIGGARFDSGLQVFENLHASADPPPRVRLDMSYNLGRFVEAPSGPMFDSAVRSLRLTRLLGFLVDTPAPRPTRPTQLRPRSVDFGPDGGSGRVYVYAQPGAPWRAVASARWIHLSGEYEGIGAGVVGYRVDPYRGTRVVRGSVRVGVAEAAVSQAPSAVIRLPFRDRITDYNRWVLENFTHSAAIGTAAPGPRGDASLLLTKTAVDARDFDTQAYLPAIDLGQPRRVRLSFWAKADPPGRIRIDYAQRVAPFANCGLAEQARVSAQWRHYQYAFAADNARCTLENNRLSIAAGDLAGRLWVSDLRLDVDGPGSPSASATPTRTAGSQRAGPPPDSAAPAGAAPGPSGATTPGPGAATTAAPGQRLPRRN